MGSFILEAKKYVRNGKNSMSPLNCPPAVNGLSCLSLPAWRLLTRPRYTIPNFSGCERGALVQDWLYESEQAASLRRLTDAEKLNDFVRHLRGDALDYHRQELARIKDYALWRKMMVAKFRRMEKSFYLEELNSLKQKPDQSVREFAQEIDSLFVKALGLRFVTERSLHGLKVQMKISTFVFGLRDGIGNEISHLVWRSYGHLPSWSRVIDAAQDAEWCIELQKKEQRAWVDPDWYGLYGEGYVKVYIAVSAIRDRQGAGYGVFFDKDDAKNVSEVVGSKLPQTCNVALIRAAVKAIQQAKNCGMSRLIIYTDSRYLLHFIDHWAVKWMKKKWHKPYGMPVLNKNEWRNLLMVLEGMDVKWANVPQNGYWAAKEAHNLARSALQSAQYHA